MVENSAIKRIQDLIYLLGHEYPAINRHPSLPPVQEFFNETLYKPLHEVIQDVMDSLPFIAKQLGKEPPKVTMEFAAIRIKYTAYEMLNSVFAHLLGNCVDHGIEPAKERQALGKKKRGTIVIGAQINERQLNIKIRDDGRGLNTKMLFQKGVDLNYWAETGKPQISEIAELVFVSGLSTRGEVNSISGRGVGMDAVKQILLSHGCNINLRVPHTFWQGEEFVPFEAVISLPRSFYVTL